MGRKLKVCSDYEFTKNTKSLWRHQMETFSALLAFCAGNSPVTDEFPLQRPGAQSFDVSLICAWINGWANNREAGDLRRHRAHYDVTVMYLAFTSELWTAIITSEPMERLFWVLLGRNTAGYRECTAIGHSLLNCSQINATEPQYWEINNKPLPEPRLTLIYVTTWRH